jgi:hypothetical protein
MSKVILEHSTRAELLGRAAPESEFGVATCQGLFSVVTRLKVGFAAEAALFEFSSGFGRSHLVSRRSSRNPIDDRLSGIVWFLHGFVLQSREARELQVRRASGFPAQGCWTTGSGHAGRSWRSPGRLGHSGPRLGLPRPHRIRSRVILRGRSSMDFYLGYETRGAALSSHPSSRCQTENAYRMTCTILWLLGSTSTGVLLTTV